MADKAPKTTNTDTDTVTVTDEQKETAGHKMDSAPNNFGWMILIIFLVIAGFGIVIWQQNTKAQVAVTIKEGDLPTITTKVKAAADAAAEAKAAIAANTVSNDKVANALIGVATTLTAQSNKLDEAQKAIAELVKKPASVVIAPAPTTPAPATTVAVQQVAPVVPVVAQPAPASSVMSNGNVVLINGQQVWSKDGDCGLVWSSQRNGLTHVAYEVLKSGQRNEPPVRTLKSGAKVRCYPDQSVVVSGQTFAAEVVITPAGQAFIAAKTNGQVAR